MVAGNREKGEKGAAERFLVVKFRSWWRKNSVKMGNLVYHNRKKLKSTKKLQITTKYGKEVSEIYKILCRDQAENRIFGQMVYIKYLTNTYQKLSKHRQSREKLDILRIFDII